MVLLNTADVVEGAVQFQLGYLLVTDHHLPGVSVHGHAGQGDSLQGGDEDRNRSIHVS